MATAEVIPRPPEQAGTRLKAGAIMQAIAHIARAGSATVDSEP